MIIKKITPSLLILALVAVFAGCTDKVITREVVGVKQVIGMVTCNKGPGFCMQCGLNLTGGYDCAPKLKNNCTGMQKALLKINTIKQSHESGDVSFIEKREIIKALSACE